MILAQEGEEAVKLPSQICPQYLVRNQGSIEESVIVYVLLGLDILLYSAIKHVEDDAWHAVSRPVVKQRGQYSCSTSIPVFIVVFRCYEHVGVHVHT